MGTLQKSFAGIVLFFILYLVTLYNFNFSVQEEKAKEQIQQNIINKTTRDYKLILLWTKYNGRIDWGYSMYSNPQYLKNSHCPETRCKFLFFDQREKYPITEYDAVVFDDNYMKDGHSVPEERSQHQIYMFLSKEPVYPDWKKNSISSLNYNLTATYRSHSDIIVPFLQFTDKETNLIITPAAGLKWRKYEQNFTDQKMIEMAKNKKKGIVAVISHCGAKSDREVLIEKLWKFFDIDVYGKCGTLKCSSARGDHKCSEEIDRTYKFYAAFENSVCQDYVTEKFYLALSRNIIPIVYGGSNYSRLAPPHSFIDVGDFEDFEQLAEYLKYLSENSKEYVKYFWWKKYYKVTSLGLNFCKWCEYLNLPGVEKRRKEYTDMTKYWSDDACTHTVKNLNSPKVRNLLSGSTSHLAKNIKRTIFDLSIKKPSNSQ